MRTHLQLEDRNQIEILLKRGYTQKEIAQVLDKAESTISREIQRHKRETGIYTASVAEHNSRIKRRNSKHQGMKIEGNMVLREQIITALEAYQSPDGISGRLGGISAPSIYKWLYSVYGARYCRYLCTKRYRKKKHRSTTDRRQMITEAVSIHERIDSPYLFEGDLFVSPSTQGHSSSVCVLVHPESQYLLTCKMDNRRPSTMVTAVQSLHQKLHIDSITFDRGIENKYHKQFGIPSYFCDPYSPWQKPYVENNIGLLRKWFVPKKTDLRCMSQKQLDRYTHIINHKWRKSLGYLSAYERALECGILKDEKLLLGV